MLVPDGAQHLVLENVISAFCKRPPAFNLHRMFLQELLGFDLLMERMGFDLVHRRYHLVMHDQIHHPVRVKVADPDGAYAAIPIQLLHRKCV